MHSGKNSVDEAVEQVTGKAERVVADIEDMIRQAGRHNSASSAQVHIHAVGLTNAFAVCGVGVCIIALILGSFWTQLMIGELRTELRQTRQDLQDQQAAWVAVMQSKVNDVKKAENH